MIEQIKKSLQKSNYDFLRTNEHLKDKIMFITLGGSYAYGTNVEGSDIDIRGCALHRKSDLIGMSHFEQVIDIPTDTVIYAFNKLISLLLNWLIITIILKISNNHNRSSDLFEKIEKILLFLKQEITQTFSNLDIFNIFKKY